MDAGARPEATDVPWWCPEVTPAWLSGFLHETVDSATFDNVRELEQSNVATLTVQPSGGRLLLKKTNVKWLRERMAKSDEKWSISVRSFENELLFYKLAPDAELDAAGAHIARVRGISSRGPARTTPAATVASAASATTASSAEDAEDYFDREYCTLLDYLSLGDAYVEYTHLNEQQTRAALRWMARFHAFWWCTAAAGVTDGSCRWSELARGLFTPGGWWRCALRPSVKYSSIPAVFSQLCADLPVFAAAGLGADPRHAALMQLLAASVDKVNAMLATGPLRTIVHGDFKTSNAFYPRHSSSSSGSSSGSSGSGKEEEMRAIDFQWSGPARTGCGDVAYMLVGAVAPTALCLPTEEQVEQQQAAAATAATATAASDAQQWLLRAFHAAEAKEAEYVRYYHDQLLLSNADIGSSFSYEALEREYELEFLCYYMTALPQLLVGLTPALAAENRAKYGWLTHEQLPVVTAWFTWRALRIAQRLADAGVL